MSLPLTHLPEVSARIAELLAQLGILTVEDLLFHLPLRYEDRTQIKPLATVKAGQTVLVEGTIQATEIKLGKC